MSTNHQNRMRVIRVTYDNGKQIETNINGADAEIRAYYIGQWFDVGYGETEIMARAVSVEFLSEGR
jgi:hypothetical protein